MAEQAEPEIGTSPEVTAPDIPASYADALKGEGTPPQESPVEEAAPTPTPVPENYGELVVGEQKIPFKSKEQFEEFIQANTLLKEGFMRDADYTQKNQADSDRRKSLETAFGGRVPEANELQSLGKLWNAYFNNPKAQTMIQSILEDRLEAPSVVQEDPNADPAMVTMKGEIQSLKDTLSKFTNSFEKREQVRSADEANKRWNSWVESKKTQGETITEEIDKQMAPFISALSQAHPEWDDTKVLDTALRHSKIGDLEKNAKKDVLVSADKAKLQQPPQITPKQGQKPDSELGYAELAMKHMVQA